MPPINDFKCDKCGFQLPSGWGGYMYVTDQTGKRIVCPHPCEFATVYQVLGANAPRELIQQRTGFNSDCLCLDCLKEFNIDLKRDARACPHCNSNRIGSLQELVDGPCPKCKEGTIQEIVTGAWS
jgi:DNA-directed RNA polymerase subunit RPC12/RpoP